MRSLPRLFTAMTILLVTASAGASAQATTRDVVPPVTKVPESFFQLLRE